MNHCGTWKIIITSIDFIQYSSSLQGFPLRTVPLQMKYTVSASFLHLLSLLFPWSYSLLICIGRNVAVFEQSGKWWLRMDYWHRRGIVASFPWMWTLNFWPEDNKGTMDMIFVTPLCSFPFPGIQFNFSFQEIFLLYCPELIWGWGLGSNWFTGAYFPKVMPSQKLRSIEKVSKVLLCMSLLSLLVEAGNKGCCSTQLLWFWKGSCQRWVAMAWQIRGLHVPLVTVIHLRVGGDPGRANET